MGMTGGLINRLFGGREGGPPVAAPPQASATGHGGLLPEHGLGTRMGHRPVLHAVLARQILDAHLRNRHQLLDPAPADLRTATPEEARLLVRAMAAAAHADGDLDAMERGRIKGVLHGSALPEEERRALERIVEEPQCLETLARQVTTPALAARFYAVSLAAVDRNAPVGRSYLRYLAQRLNLPADLVVRLNRRLGLRE